MKNFTALISEISDEPISDETENATALISGFVRSFISGEPISDGTVSARENNELKLKTDSSGKFGPFEWPVGQPLTLVFEKSGSFWSGYRTTQSATFIVPKEGINDKNYLKNISFQVPSNMACKFLSLAMGVAEDSEACSIAATVTRPNTTMDDIPQGIAGVTVTLSPEVAQKPFYFGMFPFIHKTNPFIRNLKATSQDGGVIFINIPEGIYTMEAKMNGKTFSKVTVQAHKKILVNASPPNGPTMQQESQCNEIEKKTNHYNFFKPALVIGLTAAGACLASVALSNSL